MYWSSSVAAVVQEGTLLWDLVVEVADRVRLAAIAYASSGSSGVLAAAHWTWSISSHVDLHSAPKGASFRHGQEKPVPPPAPSASSLALTHLGPLHPTRR